MKSRILVVDDESDLAALLESRLRAHHFDVEITYSGRQALTALEKKKPDLILLDLLMPDMDGCEVLSYLKKDPATKEIPVIMLSAMTQQDYVQKAMAAGAADYLLKPATSEMLLTKIKTALDSTRRIA